MIAACLLTLVPSGAAPAPTPVQAPSFAAETRALPNGLRVTLHVDPSLPKVVVDTWFAVGSKDEAPGRSGFAHLFEHLMFMGTERVPTGQFDAIMEEGGGFNNATTSQDRTNYFSVGPRALLPTLLWLDADRFEGLDDAMTVEKLDAQRDVVRNERRQSIENVPYGRVELLLPELLYPAGHPYRHTVIGSHEDLVAASLEDVVGFFRTYYVPGNASVVVAGDLDPAATWALVERTLGAVPPAPLPELVTAPPVSLAGETRAVTYDDVELAKLVLVWLSPPAGTPEDGALDLFADLLAGGAASRLEERLVLRTGLAQEVAAWQQSAELVSEFHVEVLAQRGADLAEVERETLAVVQELLASPATEAERARRAAELARVQAQVERSFLERVEDLLERADAMNAYLDRWGVADGFARDLARWTEPDAEGVRRVAREVLGAGRVVLRVLPAEGRETGALADVSGPAARAWEPGGSLDERPADLAAAPFALPAPETRRLASGVPVHLVPRPGTRLFAGALVARGGAARVPAAKSGLAELLARTMDRGAGGLDPVAWAASVERLGAELGVDAGRERMAVRVRGTSSRLAETLDRMAALVLAPDLRAEDFERERELLLSEIAARADDPRAVAGLAARALLFGKQSHRGRPVEGDADTVAALAPADARAAWRTLFAPERAELVLAGDFDPDALMALLEERFGRWAETRAAAPGGELGPVEPSPPLTVAPPGRLVLVDRPGAPQTVLQVLRPLPASLWEEERAELTCLDVVLGGSFTSRLNQNLREENGYAYGAGSRTAREGEQALFTAGASVFADVTGAALRELLAEIDGLAAGDVTPEELAKAVASARTDAMEAFATAAGAARSVAEAVADGRPAAAAARDLAGLDRATLAGVNQLARSGLLDRSRMLVVLVGDAAAVAEQLAREGFPAPLRADAEGRLLD